MNVPIFRLYAFFVVLFAVLIAFTSRWAVFGATGLRENPENKRVVLEEQRIKRGVIRARDGEVLAGSVRLSGDRYGRRYPTGREFALAVGFDSVQFGRAGLERYYNDALTGRKEELANIVDSLVEKDRVGDDLRTTLDPKAQKVANDALQGRDGAVVALDVKTAAVRVLAGTPSFNPNRPGPRLDLQHRDAGPVSAGLDDEDRDRERGDRLRPLPARFAGERSQREGDLGYAAEQLRQPELRRHHAHGGADELGQHRLGGGRRQARAQPDAGVHGPLRVHGGPADGLSRPPDERQWPARPEDRAS